MAKMCGRSGQEGNSGAAGHISLGRFGNSVVTLAVGFLLVASQSACAQFVSSGAAQHASGEMMASGTAATGAVQSVPSSASQPLPATAPSASSSMADTASASTGGNVAELQRMIHGTDLVELRTSYNGSYGASLLFYAKEVTYYVALFQQKNFWRVYKTQDQDRAEAIYADFVKQTVGLANVEIQRTLLEAQKAYTERMISLSQERAAQIEADLTIQQNQREVVASRQREARAQTAALDDQRRTAQAQLDAVRKQIADLQRQADAGLPKQR